LIFQVDPSVENSIKEFQSFTESLLKVFATGQHFAQYSNFMIS